MFDLVQSMSQCSDIPADIVALLLSPGENLQVGEIFNDLEKFETTFISKLAENNDDVSGYEDDERDTRDDGLFIISVDILVDTSADTTGVSNTTT